MPAAGQEKAMDWSHCPDVERDPEKLSGTWIVRGSRVPVQAVIDNARDGFSPEAISEMFEGVPVARVRGILRFAALHVPNSA
jgi:uncharacterized protein (DUF433 family)